MAQTGLRDDTPRRISGGPALEEEFEEGGRAWHRVLGGAILLLVALVIALWLVPSFYVDLLWFESVGFGRRFWTVFLTQVGLFAGALLLCLAFGLGNLALARFLAARRVRPVAEPADGSEAYTLARLNGLTYLGIGLVALAALGLGWWSTRHWEIVLRVFAQSPFGLQDPLFGRDIAFFVFSLPFWRFVQTWLLMAVLTATLVTGLLYFAYLVAPQFEEADRQDAEHHKTALIAVGRPVRVHLSLLLAAILALAAWHYRLEMFELVYSRGAVVFGAAYTAVNARWPLLWLLCGITALGSILMLVHAAWRGAAIPIGVAVAWVLAFVALLVYPPLVQRFHVQPTELDTERPYIERNIKMTRQAYGLDRVEEIPYPAEEAVTKEEIETNAATIKNIRLWDPQPLLITYNQLQSIRLYYDFVSTHFDRYMVNGEYRQVIISARELTPERLPPDAQTWVNRRLKFTHGYGVVVSPVNEVTPEGLPTFFVQDVPPRGALRIDRPEIYYGELTNELVILRTRTQEFDYPRGEQNVETTYQADSGVRAGSLFRRLMFAWHFKDPNIFVSGYITPDSLMVYNRNIAVRANKVAPFLLYDIEPYIVIADGRLYWIHDAYTYSNRYPYAQPINERFNYIRNSVKLVTDAYTGAMTYYIADPDDPLIRAYAAIFPEFFRPLEDMPPSLRAHLRYPQSLFRVQAQMYRTYHMQDPTVFYNREDQLGIPTEIYLDRRALVQPYYAIMRLPGSAREEFVLILPYTPTNKDNMITWLAARSDSPNYGKLVAYKYPKERLIFGPAQIEARIDQDPVVSQQFTLWNQAGSRVIRGNMLVIPIGRSNLYVEPIYLQAERGRLPEMKRVVLASGNRVVMEATVEEALEKLFGGPITYRQPIAPPAGATSPPMPAPAEPGATAPPAGPLPVPALDRAALVDVIRSLRERSARIEGELLSIQEELRRLEVLLQESAPGQPGTAR
jgi:uncharacterized membrane protein (UPF0182 family)